MLKTITNLSTEDLDRDISSTSISVNKMANNLKLAREDLESLLDIHRLATESKENFNNRLSLASTKEDKKVAAQIGAKALQQLSLMAGVSYEDYGIVPDSFIFNLDSTISIVHEGFDFLIDQTDMVAKSMQGRYGKIEQIKDQLATEGFERNFGLALEALTEDAVLSNEGISEIWEKIKAWFKKVWEAIFGSKKDKAKEAVENLKKELDPNKPITLELVTEDVSNDDKDFSFKYKVSSSIIKSLIVIDTEANDSNGYNNYKQDIELKSIIGKYDKLAKELEQDISNLGTFLIELVSKKNYDEKKKEEAFKENTAEARFENFDANEKVSSVKSLKVTFTPNDLSEFFNHVNTFATNLNKEYDKLTHRDVTFGDPSDEYVKVGNEALAKARKLYINIGADMMVNTFFLFMISTAKYAASEPKLPHVRDLSNFKGEYHTEAERKERLKDTLKNASGRLKDNPTLKDL